MTYTNQYFDEAGRLCVRNLSAYWIPEITLSKKIRGTTYVVSGSYEGSQRLDKKLLRIMEQNVKMGEPQP
jgi:hypothetical protein